MAVFEVSSYDIEICSDRGAELRCGEQALIRLLDSYGDVVDVLAFYPDGTEPPTECVSDPEWMPMSAFEHVVALLNSKQKVSYHKGASGAFPFLAVSDVRTGPVFVDSITWRHCVLNHIPSFGGPFDDEPGSEKAGDGDEFEEHDHSGHTWVQMLDMSHEDEPGGYYEFTSRGEAFRTLQADGWEMVSFAYAPLGEAGSNLLGAGHSSEAATELQQYFFKRVAGKG